MQTVKITCDHCQENPVFKLKGLVLMGIQSDNKIVVYSHFLSLSDALHTYVRSMPLEDIQVAAKDMVSVFAEMQDRLKQG